MEDRWHGMVRLTSGAGDLADFEHGDLFLELEEVFAVDSAVGMERLVGDVGQDGGAARENGAFVDELEESGEELVDVNGGVELGELREEFREEVEGIIWRMLKPGADGGTRG
jgi:hypothetical protein